MRRSRDFPFGGPNRSVFRLDRSQLFNKGSRHRLGAHELDHGQRFGIEIAGVEVLAQYFTDLYEMHLCEPAGRFSVNASLLVSPQKSESGVGTPISAGSSFFSEGVEKFVVEWKPVAVKSTERIESDRSDRLQRREPCFYDGLGKIGCGHRHPYVEAFESASGQKVRYCGRAKASKLFYSEPSTQKIGHQRVEWLRSKIRVHQVSKGALRRRPCNRHPFRRRRHLWCCHFRPEDRRNDASAHGCRHSDCEYEQRQQVCATACRIQGPRRKLIPAYIRLIASMRLRVEDNLYRSGFTMVGRSGNCRSVFL